MKKITLQQVADHCRISLAVASRVINGKPGVASEIRKRVLAAVETLGYSAGTGSRKHIAVLYNQVMCFEKDNYSQLLCSELYNVLTARNYWFYGIHSTEQLKSYPFFAAVTIRPVQECSTSWGEEFNIPMITINNPESALENIYAVTSDEFDGMEKAVAYLYNKGHRRIGLMLFEVNDWSSAKRLNGYCQAMRKRLLPEETFLQIIPSEAPYYESLGKLIHAGITALIAPGEGVGQKIVRTLTLYKHRIPEDISLLSWEVPGMSKEWQPPLTTLCQDFCGLAEGVADILDALADRKSPPAVLRVPYLFHERESIGAPRESKF